MSTTTQSAAVSERAQALIARGLMALPDRALRLGLRRPVVLDGQQLEAEVQLALKLLALGGEPPLEELTPASARAQIAHDAQAFKGRPFDVSSVQELRVAGPEGELGARLYVPYEETTALLVYFHGGGFVVCDLETHDNTCRLLASRAGVRVLSVDYRLAPEHRFPAAIDDAFTAFRFAVEHATELGCDPDRIAVGGDSAGGNLAAGVARLAALDGGPAPAFQLLFYPWLDLTAKRASYRLFGEGFFLTEAELDWYRAHYVPSDADAHDPRCSPLLADDWAGAAPAYIATAGFDPLRDEGEEFATRLREAGVRAVVRRHRGLIHGFVNVVGLGRVGREAVLEAAGALRTGVAPA
jgi:acetyl esterase